MIRFIYNAKTGERTMVEVPDPVPQSYVPQPYDLRKDVIFQRLCKIGKGVAFASLLKQDLIAERWWNDSPCVVSDNPVWLQYQAAFIPLLEMTDEEVAYVAKEGTDV